MTDRIVVIDDDIMSLRLARRVFDKAGIDGTYLSSAEEMYRYLEGSTVPDLVLLDVHMPDVNGFELFDRIIAVADMYDAMTSNRSYRQQLPQFVVREEFVRCRGTQLDPVFADIMIQMIDEDKDFTMRERTDEQQDGSPDEQAGQQDRQGEDKEK